MLVLTRRPSEEVIIGGNIRVIVIAVKGDKVTLAFDAPKDVPIHRLEIQEVIDGTKAKQQQRPDSGRTGSDRSEESGR